MLIATGLFEGTALLSLITNGAVAGLSWLGLALGLINAMLWQHYRRTARAAGIGPLSARDIDALQPVVLWAGYVLGAALFGIGVIIPNAALVGGLIAIAGGFFWKYLLVTKVCHQQGFALPKVPSRGSGSNAAPASRV